VSLARVHRRLQNQQFGRLRDYLLGQRVRPGARWNGDMNEVMKAVEWACLWYLRKSQCLHRSATLATLLRRKGVEAEMVIGIKTTPYSGHAWVEVDGVAVNEDRETVASYTPVERL
jgi:hypothetical protein